MPSNTQEAERPRLSVAALDEWMRDVEYVMRGIAHALNNRAAALAAVIELSRDPEDGDATATETILNAEVQRVAELAAVVRSVGAPRRGDETFAPIDAANEALRVLQLHLEQRERAPIIDAAQAAPVRTQRWMFVRALLALAIASAERTTGSMERARISIGEADGGDWVVARVQGIDANTEELSPYAAAMALAMGGAVLDGECGFRVPSLAAIRRREGR